MPLEVRKRDPSPRRAGRCSSRGSDNGPADACRRCIQAGLVSKGESAMSVMSQLTGRSEKSAQSLQKNHAEVNRLRGAPAGLGE